VQLSTFANWVQVAHWYAKLQGDRVVVDDHVRQKAAELTRGATTPLEKTHRLYDYVAGNVRYVSLSFGVGRLQPHAASEVLQNGFGDCKDKHTLLQALLRAADIPSYPVLINSYRKLDPDVPSPAQFDHEITAVRVGKSEDLTWLDSTAEVAPYGLIMYQLRNKSRHKLAPERRHRSVRAQRLGRDPVPDERPRCPPPCFQLCNRRDRPAFWERPEPRSSMKMSRWRRASGVR
jgi:transglutaminase-like putative cysteine protease